MNRPRRDRRWQSPKDRARVAAELIEEAELLSETCLIATPADLIQATRPPPIHLPREASVSLNGSSNTSHVPIAPALSELPAPRPSPAFTAPPARDPEEVLAELDQALGTTPDDAAALLARAGLLGSLGNYAAARRDLERLLRVSPDHGEALTALGVVLSRRGLWGEASLILQRAVTVDGSRSTAWYYLGEALNHQDDLSGALAAFTRAAELEPAHAKSWYGQGIVLDRLNRPEEATRMYRRARDVSRR